MQSSKDLRAPGAKALAPVVFCEVVSPHKSLFTGVNMFKKLAQIVVAAALASGCGPGSFNGTVGSKSLNVADAVFFPWRTNGALVAVTLMMTDKPNICNTLKANRIPKSANYMSLTVFRSNAQGTQLAPDTGDYTITTLATPPAGNFAYGDFGALDANCTNQLTDAQSVANSGLIKITNFKAEASGAMAGNFDITFGTDKTTGTFNAPFCDLTSNFPANPSCE